MGTLLAKHASLVVTMDSERRELRDAGLFARDGFIEQVAPTAELPKSADIVLDLAGQILLPGLINCHHHLDQVITRDIPAGQDIDAAPGSMLQIALAPCSPFSVSADLMRIGAPRAAVRGPAAHSSLRNARRRALHARAPQAPSGR